MPPHPVRLRGQVSLTVCLSALVLALSLLSLCLGPAALKPNQALTALVSDQGGATTIVREIRLPRTLLALMLGGMLGLSGAALQGLLRNPLADASVFGAPQMAALGVVLTLTFGWVNALDWGLPAAGIVGACLSFVCVLLVSGRHPRTVVLILAGLAVGSFAGAATTLALSLSPNPFALTEIVFWLLGSLEDRSLRHVLMAAPFIAIGMAFIFATSQALQALSLGEDTARSLGFSVTRTQLLIVGGSALGVGASVAVAGGIGFIGLIAPHLVRPLVGYDPARTLLPSLLTGAGLLLAADCGVRLIPSQLEVKVGVITALIGMPVFLWSLIHARADVTETCP